MTLKDKKELENYFKAKAIADGLTQQLTNEDKSVNEDVSQWIHENEFATEAMNRFSDKEEFSKMMSQCQTIIESKEDEITLLKQRIVAKKEAKEQRKILLFKSSIVAAAVIVLSFILYNNSNRDLNHETALSVDYIIDQTTNLEVAPSLILGDGKTIDLSASSDIIEVEDKSTITKSGNLLNYIEQEIDSNRPTTTKYNTLIVPKSCTYSILFADSSEVVMNANSELRYPTKFEGSARQVYLKGEAYFKIRKSVNPFIVHCDNVSIQVYGTEFNVNFSDSTVVKTVLVSGSVGIKFKDDPQDRIIKPNEMLIANIQSNTKDVTSVNSARYTAWKDNYFRSDNESLLSLLSDISKWYNVVFTYNRAELSNITVSASLRRTLPIEEILKSIEILSNVKFIKKEGGIYSIE